MNNFQFSIFNFQKKRGYTLIELIIAVGLFALVMTLASGAYLVMIGISRQTQAIATGIDNLSFALETMTRTIRTGTEYTCPGGTSNCTTTTFSVRNESFVVTSYRLSGGAITQTQNGAEVPLTDPLVTVSSLLFYASGTTRGDDFQPRVTMIVSGTVSSEPGKTTPFTVETSATMRGSDI